MNPLASTPMPARAVRLHAVSRRLQIDWQDGSSSVWTHSMLRECCRCAECLARQRQGQFSIATPHIELTDVKPYGLDALRFTFSDGHSRGIYPFEYLRQLSERPALAAELSASGDTSS